MTNITYTVNQDTPQSIPSVEILSQEDTNLINTFQVNQLFDSSEHVVELHIYNLAGELQESEYDYRNYKELGNAASAGKKGASILTIDPIEDVKLYGYDNGGVKLFYNFINDLYTTGRDRVEFFIDSISPDRTELKLKTFNLSSEELSTFTTSIKTKLETQSYFNEFRVNLLSNDLLIGVNIDTLQEGSDTVVVVKLYEPLLEDIVEKSTLSIVELVSDSTVYEVTSTFETEAESALQLRSPNFNLDLVDENVIPTDYYTYDTLLSLPITNSTNELYSLVNSKGVQLSIDHNDYSNFIHFSSAQERLLNFKYKLDLIQLYTTQIENVQAVTTPSLGTTGSITYYQGLMRGIVNNFDHYERFLYYESGSNSWPKTNSTKPYINDTTSGADTWFNDKLTVAATYDDTNTNILINSIPSYLRDDNSNASYITFVHMIGQHFDNMWIYAKGISDKYDADNRLNFGVARDLVAEVLKNFGVKLYTSNKSTEDLFSSLIGQVYQSGSEVISTYVTGSITGSGDIIQPSSFDNYQKEVYKRIYHNLPLLLKSKGTERGLRALVNCFGIPSDIMDIKLYGGKDTNEKPFYGDYMYYTSSLDKIRLDHTGSTVEGNTLSSYTSIVKRDNKYTDDIHPVGVGFSPTDNVDNYIISKSLSTGSLSSFNIDDYLGDPRNLYESQYNTYSSKGAYTGDLYKLTNQIMSSSSAYNVKDYVRLIKFFDNTIFKMVKDFIPARSTVDTGIVVKPHILQRNKAKSVKATVDTISTASISNAFTYTASIDTAFIEGDDAGGFYTSTPTLGTGNKLKTSYIEVKQIPTGIATIDYHNHQEATFDGELANSGIVISNGELNANNLFKTPSFTPRYYNIGRWLNNTGLCILNPIQTYTDNTQDVYTYGTSPVTFYLDSGSYGAGTFLSGLSPLMSYQITSSNQPTSSYSFPFNTDNYSNYTVHHVTASNLSVIEGNCTSSFDIKVAICDIETTPAFTSAVKPEEVYNITSWFTTGSQNANSNMSMSLQNVNTSQMQYSGSLQGATAVGITGSAGHTYTLTVQDKEIPLTCTYTYTLSATLCSITPALLSSFPEAYSTLVWNSNIGTYGFAGLTPVTAQNYGLARFFNGTIDTNVMEYQVEIEDRNEIPYVIRATVTMTPGGSGTGTFYYIGGNPYLDYQWSYGPTTTPYNIPDNVALFKLKYNNQVLLDNEELSADTMPIEGYAFRVKITAKESINCTPLYTIYPPTEPEPDPEDPNPCCFTGDTLVTLSNRSTIRIDEVQVGDEVLSYNELTGNIETGVVRGIAKPTKKDIVKYTLSNETVVEATTEHPIWTVNGGWKSYSPATTERNHNFIVDELEVGDILLTQDGEEVIIVEMQLDTNRVPEVVYNLSLNGHPTYYANGIVVHNKTIEQQEQCIY